MLLRNRAHDVSGVRLGGPEPAALEVIVGVTPGETDPAGEFDKATRAAGLGVRMLTDVTTNADPTLRRRILDNLDVAFGTVPSYEIHRAVCRGGRDPRDAVLSVLHRQAEEGVDFVTIHATATRERIEGLATAGRTIPMTSRGGAMMVEVALSTGGENPYWEHFDEILDLCADAGMAVRLAATFRPGSVADAMDDAHLSEVRLQAELVRRANARGVGVLVELINHVPLHLVKPYCDLAGELLDGAPFGALGPSPTDIAATYDDVAGAIGAATAVHHGVSWVTCVTAGEHCYIPRVEETIRAIRYFQVALHIGQIARTGELDRDAEFSRARNDNDWTEMGRLALHPDEATATFERLGYHHGEACTMCRGACPLVRTRILANDLGMPRVQERT